MVLRWVKAAEDIVLVGISSPLDALKIPPRTMSKWVSEAIRKKTISKYSFMTKPNDKYYQMQRQMPAKTLFILSNGQLIVYHFYQLRQESFLLNFLIIHSFTLGH
jgi:hypothetical protein